MSSLTPILRGSAQLLSRAASLNAVTPSAAASATVARRYHEKVI